MCLQIKQNLKLLIGLSNSLVICLSQEARKALFKATFLFKLYIKLWHSFFEWAKPDLFFVYIWSFQTINTIFTTNQCEEMSCPSSILCQDSNPRSLEHESPPITTRPGLPPLKQNFPSCLNAPLSIPRLAYLLNFASISTNWFRKICIFYETACWGPACYWLGWGSMSIGDDPPPQ